MGKSTVGSDLCVFSLQISWNGRIWPSIDSQTVKVIVILSMEPALEIFFCSLAAMVIQILNESGLHLWSIHQECCEVTLLWKFLKELRLDFVPQGASNNLSWDGSCPAREFYSLIERSYAGSSYFKVNIFAKLFRIGLH